VTFETRVLPEVHEFTAAEVERELRRGHGWAARHYVELFGYFEDGRWRFPLSGVRRYQEQQAQRFAS
jgi:hypothetical protein